MEPPIDRGGLAKFDMRRVVQSVRYICASLAGPDEHIPYIMVFQRLGTPLVWE